MPELPEVETTRRGIEPHVLNNRVVRVDVRQPRLRWPVSPGLAQSLIGRAVTSVDRRAKYLLLCTPGGRLMVHLGMSGSLRVLPGQQPAGKHDHVDIGFENGAVLRYRDPRRFGSMFWLDDDSSHSLLDHLGPEPLSSEFTGDVLFRRSRQRRVPVKSFIMNSQIVVGVGNIYANEAMFRAGIRPDRLAASISRLRYRRLADSIKDVLEQAIAAGGTTLRDFVREDGSPGYFQARLDVYGRQNQACVVCGRKLKEIRQSGRTTVYCSGCQR